MLEHNTTVASALSGNILNAATRGRRHRHTPPTANIVKQGYAGFTTGNYDTQVGPGRAGRIADRHRPQQSGRLHPALESVAERTVLANPKVLVLNKQPGEVQVGQQFGYLTTTTVPQTTSTQTVQFLNTGTILSFRPYVGDDGYIRMEIHPEDSNGGLNDLQSSVQKYHRSYQQPL